MKILNGKFLSLIAVLLFPSCVNSTLELDAPEGMRRLSAAPPQGIESRTALVDHTPSWCAGDCIWISNGEKSVSITLSQEDIRSDGKFEISINDMPGKLYMLYPASYVKDFVDGRVTVSFPESADGSFAAANVAAASVPDGGSTADFKNIGSVFKIQIDPDLAKNVAKVQILCPGISGQYISSADDISIVSAVATKTVDAIEVATSGLSECYVGIPPITMPAGTEFIFWNNQDEILYSRTTSKDNTIGRNRLFSLSFLKQSVKLVQKSVLDPAWHEGDKVTLTDGQNTENFVISSDDIAPDGSVTVKTQLLVRDGNIKAVCPSSLFMGVNVNADVLVNIPSHQDGTAEGADITYAECSEGILTFNTIAPVIKMKGLPGAAKSLCFDSERISCGQKIKDNAMQSISESGHSKLSMDLTRLGSSVYYIAVSPSALSGTIHYYDGNGKDIGTNAVSFSKTSVSSVWEYGPLRDIASIDLGDGYSNWLGYYPDDAMIPDLIMPGTHDAGTYGYDGILSGQVKCQSIDFTSQLQKGVRCFDLRLSENMNIFHGSFYCNVGLSTFLDSSLAFLRSHPREVVFIFCKDENSEGDEALWNQHFQETIDSYGRSNFVIDKKLAAYTLGQLRGKIVITTRSRSAGSFGYLEGAPQINFPDDSWTIGTSGGDLTVALEDNYTAEKGDPKKNKIFDFFNAINKEGAFMDEKGHRTRWIVAFTSGYKGYTFGIPYPEDFCDDLLDTGIISDFQNKYDNLTCNGITFFHDFIQKWDSYTGHLFTKFVKKK